MNTLKVVYISTAVVCGLTTIFEYCNRDYTLAIMYWIMCFYFSYQAYRYCQIHKGESHKFEILEIEVEYDGKEKKFNLDLTIDFGTGLFFNQKNVKNLLICFNLDKPDEITIHTNYPELDGNVELTKKIIGVAFDKLERITIKNSSSAHAKHIKEMIEYFDVR